MCIILVKTLRISDENHKEMLKIQGQIQAQSGVAGPIREPNTALFGSPAIPYRDYIRSYAIFKKLPALYKRLHELEKKLKSK